METLQRTANRGSVSTGYDIDYSVKLQDTASEYFQRSASGSDGDRRTMTLSMWLKRTEPGNDHIFYSQGSHVRFRFKTSDYFSLRLASGHEFENESRLFRDPSAWYHMVVAIDTTQSTDTNRVKIYWNGVQETTFNTAQYPDQNEELTLGQFSSVTTQLGWFVESGYGFDGYFAEVQYIDGLQKAPTDFGKFDSDSGIWQPIKYTGSYGTEGFYLNFSAAGDMGNDSVNNNDFTVQNINQNDQATDTPTNNFCIGNELVNFAPGGQDLFQGATRFYNPSGQNWQSITGTFGLTSGKWYWEFQTTGTGAFVGISDVEDDIIPQNTGGYFLGYGDDNSSTTNSLGMYSANGVIYNDAGSVAGASYASSNIVGVALDMDNRKIHFAVDNSWAGSSDPANNTNGATWNTSWSDTVHPAFSCAQNNEVIVNYGGYTVMSISSAANDANGYGTFEYAPPSGFYSICTKNLAEYG
tara:strand:+ start:326 stop:1729 length:1404 start_codon:yes stop_codon:yes gene_type:complete